MHFLTLFDLSCVTSHVGWLKISCRRQPIFTFSSPLVFPLSLFLSSIFPSSFLPLFQASPRCGGTKLASRHQISTTSPRTWETTPRSQSTFDAKPTQRSLQRQGSDKPDRVDTTTSGCMKKRRLENSWWRTFPGTTIFGIGVWRKSLVREHTKCAEKLKM